MHPRKWRPLAPPRWGRFFVGRPPATVGWLFRRRVGALIAPMPELPEKITLGEMRSSGVRGLLVYCADYKCAHAVRISGRRYPARLGLGHAAKGPPRPIGARALHATLRTRRRAFCVLPLMRAPPRVVPSESA